MKESPMKYDKAVEVENLKENASRVLESIAGLNPDDAMNALGAAVSQVVITNWPPQARANLLDAWFSMVRSSLAAIRP
jgi:hypothetical protein